MVGVLALFPVASSAGRESSEETQAAVMAQTVISDLRISTASRGRTNGWLVSGKNTFGDFLQPINLGQANRRVIAYDVKRRDRADSGGGDPLIGPPLALKAIQEVSLAEYSNGVPAIANATYLSFIQTRPVSSFPGTAEVIVEISTPSAVNLTNRRIYRFTTLMSAP